MTDSRTDLSFKNISVHFGATQILSNVSAKLTPGELVALVGPNGAGKTTLLQCALGLQKMATGMVALNGQNIDLIAPVERAKQIAYLPQIRPLAWPLRVKDIVALGRYAYGSRTGKISATDEALGIKAMRDCGIEHLAQRRADQLSGGELARVHCAPHFRGKYTIAPRR